MKCYQLLLILILFSNCSCKSQTKSISKNRVQIEHDDSLSKYSYLITGITTRNDSTFWIPMATGFFVRGGKGYIFVTARHAISGISTFSGKPNNFQFDSLGIRYFSKGDDSVKYIYINVSEWKKRILNKLFYELPDVIGLRINDFPKDAKIFSIENILSRGLPSGIPYKALIYGYANDSLTPTFDADHYLIRHYECTLADEKHIDPHYPQDTITNVLMPAATYGMSGSPVFFIYKTLININK